MLVYAHLIPETSQVLHSPSDTELSLSVQEHLANAEACIDNEVCTYSERCILPCFLTFDLG